MWMKDPNFDDFCTGSGDRMYVADFDSDDRDDLICQSKQDFTCGSLILTL